MTPSSPPNLADPDREPTDDELQALAREAFADVAARHAEALARMRKRIAELRAEALARLAHPAAQLASEAQ